MTNQTTRAPAKAGAHHEVFQSNAARAARAGDGPRSESRASERPPQGRGDECRTDWTREEIADLFDLPFDELMWEAQGVHRRHHARGEVQLCTLLSIKTGGCVEDCGYCSQSKSADSGLKATKLMDVRAVLQAAAQAKDSGSKRFCMGAAWRNPKDRDMPAIVELVKSVRGMGMETCMTLGMLSAEQAQQLAEAGLDYYNHNLDTSPEHYTKIVSTHTFDDRLRTIRQV